MKSFIELLESRTLMSTSPSLVQLRYDGTLTENFLYLDGKVALESYNLVYKNLNADHELKANKAALHTVLAGSFSGFKNISKAVMGTTTLIRADAKTLIGDYDLLAKHPTNASLSARVSAASDKLSLDATNQLATITADIAADGDANSANLTALIDANPSNTLLSSQATTVLEPSATTAATNLTRSVTNELTPDVAAVVAAYPG